MSIYRSQMIERIPIVRYWCDHLSNNYKFQKKTKQQQFNNYILFLIMKLSICGLIWVIVLLGTTFAADEETHLTYFVDYEEEQEEDYIEVQLEIESQSRSLVQAISNAGKVANEISVLANNYCKENAKKGKGDCKQAVEVSKFAIQPKYQIVRKQATFSTFVVTHDITIKVFAPDTIGHLIDSILRYPELTLKGFQWQPLNEVDSEQAAIKQGLQQGQGLCEQVGLSLGKIIDIEQIIQDEEEEAEKDQQEEQQEQQQGPEVTTYKFQVECIAKTKPKSK